MVKTSGRVGNSSWTASCLYQPSRNWPPSGVGPPAFQLTTWGGQPDRKLAFDFGRHRFHEGKAQRPPVNVNQHQVDAGPQIAQVTVAVVVPRRGTILVARRHHLDGRDKLALTEDVDGCPRFRTEQGTGLEVGLGCFDQRLGRRGRILVSGLPGADADIGSTSLRADAQPRDRAQIGPVAGRQAFLRPKQ